MAIEIQDGRKTKKAKANSENDHRNNHKLGRPTTLKTHDEYITYTYDTHGRLLYKTQTPLGKDGQPLKQSNSSIVGYRKSLQLEYNANNELSKSLSIIQEGLTLTEVITTYQYDAFGRRIAKHSQTKNKTKRINKKSVKFTDHHIQQQKTKYKHSHYLWDGDRQLQEYTDTHIFTTIYDQDSFEPVARLVWMKEGLTIAANESVYQDNPHINLKVEPKSSVQIYHYHNDQLGTPNELTNDKGEIVWLADYEAWGNTAKVVWREQVIDQIQVSQYELQPIRFQGQHYDTETGLHYNRFRYYDPDVGMFISRDPIGLMGGDNVFQYAPNPTGWVDPLGLNPAAAAGRAGWAIGGAANVAMEAAGISLGIIIYDAIHSDENIKTNDKPCTGWSKKETCATKYPGMKNCASLRRFGFKYNSQAAAKQIAGLTNAKPRKKVMSNNFCGSDGTHYNYNHTFTHK